MAYEDVKRHCPEGFLQYCCHYAGSCQYAFICARDDMSELYYDSEKSKQMRAQDNQNKENTDK